MNYFEKFLQKVSNDLFDDDEVLIVKKIMENIDHLYDLNLEDLAQMTYSSSATIIRFIKRLGFKSYSDFKNKVSVGYEDNKLYKGLYQNSHKSTKEIIHDEIHQHMQMIDHDLSVFDLERMKDLIQLMVNSRSVTIVGDFRSLEIFYVLNLTVNAYGVPCYIFKQGEVLLDHLKELNEDDLVIYIENLIDYEHCIELNRAVRKAIIQVTKSTNPRFEEEEIYQIIEDSDDVYLALLLIGKTIYNYFPLFIEGGITHE